MELGSFNNKGSAIQQKAIFTDFKRIALRGWH
jgi:hypothetical protein